MSNRRRSALDAPWRHNIVTAPVLFALGVFAAGAVLRASLLSPWWVLGFAALGVVVAAGSAATYGAPRPVVWYALAVAAVSGAWLTWTRFTTVWSKGAVFALVCGVAALGPFYALVRYSGHRRHLAEREEARLRVEAVVRGEWPKLFAEAKLPGMLYVDRAETPAGYSVTLQLPRDGTVTYSRVLQAREQLEVVAELAHGSLRVERGAAANLIVVHVREREILSETVPLPVDRQPQSIRRPATLGVFETGEPFSCTFREFIAMFAGQRGSGKSSLLNVVLAFLTACPDAVVFLADGKQGRTARPWLEPYIQGRTARPVLDWVAVTPAETDALLAGGLAIVEYRARVGRGDKVTPTAGMPAVILIMEESAMLIGSVDLTNSRRTRNSEKVVFTGRSEAVDAVFVAQRGTVTMLGSGDLKSQANMRFGFGVASEADAQAIFSDSKLATELYRLAREEYEGVAIAEVPGLKRPVPLKVYWADPDLIPGIAHTNTEWAGRLDEGSARAAHDAVLAMGIPGGYFDRWSRYPRTPHAPEPAVAPGGGSGGSDGAPGGDSGPGVPRRQGDPRGKTTAARLGLPPSKLVPSPFQAAEDERVFWDLVTPLTPAGGEAADPRRTPGGASGGRRAGAPPGTPGATPAEPPHLPPGVTPGGDPPVTPAATPGGPGGDPRGGAPGAAVPPVIAAVARVFTSLDADRLHTTRLLAELPGDLTPQRLGRLLGACGVKPTEPFDRDGTRARGYVAADVYTALGRARAGHVFGPAAFDWPG